MLRQHLKLGLLAAVVTALHVWLTASVATNRLGWGAAESNMPVRMQVAFVRELQQQRPPAAAPTVHPTAPPPSHAPTRPVQPVAAAASAPSPEPERIEVVQAPVEAAALPASAASTALSAHERVAGAAVVASAASAPTPDAPPPMPPDVQATAPMGLAVIAESVATAASATAATENFAWPPSTRLSYTLTGHYRGAVEGQAQVDWLLEGARYQVHMDLSIGPSFAPIASRRVSSEGVITTQGLAPRRYVEETRALLQQPRRLMVTLDEDRVRLAHGSELARPAQVQDSASQFVHLTWLFTTQPDRLRTGQRVSLPLALPRHLETWIYEVVGPETLKTPAGEVETFHVKPRRPPRASQDLTAEIWVAPSLQYLPVRIVIRQDESTYLDLLIARLPQQAQRAR